MTAKRDPMHMAVLFAAAYMLVLIIGFIDPKYSLSIYMKLALSIPILIYVALRLATLSPYYSVTPLVLVTITMYWTILMLLGLVNGLTINASAPTLLAAILNIAIFTPLLLARAFAPTIMLSRSDSKTLHVLLVVVFQILPLVTIPELQRGLQSLRSAMVLLVQELLPALTVGISIALLALLREYRAIAVLVLGIQLPYYALPVLPNVNPWLLSTVTIATNSLLSMLLTLVLQRLSNKPRGSISLYSAVRWRGSSIRDTIVTIALGVVLVLLITSGYRPLVIVSNSMLPNIERGDIVIVAPVGEEDLEKGDIIAYYREGYGIVVHRIVEIKKTASGTIITTKGDANTVEDEPITYRNVVGRVAFIIPSLGKVSLTTRSLIHDIQEVIDRVSSR